MKAAMITTLLALLIGGGGTFLWQYYGGFQSESATAVAFIDTYGDYIEVTEQVETLVHLPGTEGNADRAELLALLNSILTEKITVSKRETLARLAYSNLDTLKKEIDTAQIAQEEVYKVLQDLDNASREFNAIDLQKKANVIFELARKRAEYSARITSILSEMNEHTYAILTRILADKGELSQRHINEINISTNYAQERFDNLEDLYAELINKKSEMESKFQEFVKVAL